MSNIIEVFYYGNLEPQEINSELTPKLKKKLSNLAEKEEQLTAFNILFQPFDEYLLQEQ